MNTYLILEDNMDRLQKKLGRIRTKCEKYGCDFYYKELGEQFRAWVDPEGQQHQVKYIEVECEGTAVVNGWKFAATIQHEDTGNIIRNIIDIEVPERYRNCPPTCEHCQSKRIRKNTYLVYNEETSEFKQVGTNCLCDFTGGYSAELAAEYIALFDELIKGESAGGGIRPEEYYPIKDILKYAVKLVSQLGYVSTSSAEYDPESTTKYKAFLQYRYDNMRYSLYKAEVEEVETFRGTHDSNFDSEENLAEVNTLLDYILSIDEDSEYIHNLQVLAKSGYSRYSQLGYVVSMVPVYNKYIRKLQKEEAQKKEAEMSTSEFQGEVGKRITVENIESAEAITGWETLYGYTTRFKFTDESGNVYMWDSSSGIYADQKIDKITGTVKKHDEFRGIKQTWLTRCRITYKPEETAANEDSIEDAVEDFLNELNK